MSGENKLVVFELNQQKFALSISGIQEIIRLPTIIKMPSAPVYMKGIINFRGHIIPIIGLCNYMKLPEKASDQESRIIVVEYDGTLLGLVVDSVAEVIHYSDSEVRDAESIINNECTSGFIQRDAFILQVIELDRLLTQTGITNRREEL